MSRYVLATRAGTGTRKRMLSGEVSSGTRGPVTCIMNSLISELWTPDVSCQILLEIHKFVTW